MEPYLLTQDDINTLTEKGFDMNGVAAGSEAVAGEIQALNLGIPTQSFDEVPVPAGELPVNVPSSTPAPAPAQITPAAAPAQGADRDQILATLTGSQAAPAAPADPFANLSKTQRRMLAFAGLSDAGAALQGMKGGNVSAMLGRFNEMQDTQRKREAAEKSRQMISGMVGEVAGNDPRMMRAMMLLTNPATQALGEAMLAQIAAEKGQTQAEAGVVAGASKTLDTVDALYEAVAANPQATGFWGAMLRNVPFSKAGELKVDVTTLRSNMALDALKTLKATGATLGSVSEKELELLEADIQLLNLNQSQEKVLADLDKIRRQYQSTIRKAYATTDNAQALTEALGGRPSWLDPAPNQSGASPSVSGKTWDPEAGEFR